MRLVTYDEGKAARAGLTAGGWVADLERAARGLGQGRLPAAVRELLAAGEDALARAQATAAAVEELALKVDTGKARRPVWLIPDERIHLGPPIADPQKIICLGLNYLDHIKEQEGRLHRTFDPPPNPIIFAKFPTALLGPYDPISLPPVKVTAKVDYEVELAVVIGRVTKGVSAREALASVAGYMVLNDLSARDCQFNDKQWVRAKSFDGFAPCGPCLTTADEIGDPHRLRLWTVVNGESRQESTTRNVLFKIPRIIAYLSQAMTLLPGDIISTGTPAGVGAFRDPAVFLAPGDTVECGVERLGTLCNTCERVK